MIKNNKGLITTVLIVVLLLVSCSAFIYSLVSIYFDMKKKEQSQILNFETIATAKDPAQEKLIENLKRSLNSSIRENSRIASEAEGLAGQIDNLKTAISDRNNQLAFLSSERQRLEAASERRVAEYEDKLKQSDAQQSQIKQLLEEEAASHKQQDAALRQEIARLEGELKQASQKMDDLQRSTEVLRESSLVRETAGMHYNLGNHFVETKRYDMAIREYLRTIELLPNDADAHYNLALVYDIYMNDYQAAINHYSRFIELKPGSENKNSIMSRINDLQLKKSISISPTWAQAKNEHEYKPNSISIIPDQASR